MDKSFLIFFISAFLLVVLFIPQFLGFAYSNGDAVFSFYPALQFYSQQLRGENNFLWSDAVLTGFPVYLDLLGGLRSPINFIIFKYLSVVDAYNVAIFIGTALLFTFSYLAGRGFGISPFGALFSAIAFSFGYHQSNWSSNIAVVNAMFVLPLLAYVLNKVMSGKYWYILWGGLGVGYALISGQPQWVLMGFVGGALLIFSKSLSGRKERKIKHCIIIFTSILAIALIGFVLAYFQLAPSQIIASLSARSQGISFSAAQISALNPLDLIWYILPNITFKYLNAQEPTLYIGMLPILFAIISVLKNWKERKIWPFLAMFIFGIAASFKYSPVFWLIHQLPIFEYFRGSNRWMYIGNFGLAMMAGVGLDLALSGSVTKEIWALVKKSLGYIIATVAMVVTLANVIFWPLKNTILTLLYNYFDSNLYAKTSGGLPLEHYHNAIKSLVMNNFSNISLLNVKFVLALVFLGISYLMIKKISSTNVGYRATFSIIAISAFNLVILHPNYYEIISHKVIEEKPAIVNEIYGRENETNSFRIFSVLTGSAVDQKLRTNYSGAYDMKDQIIFERDVLETNIDQFWNLDSVDGLNNLMPRRVARLLAILGSERATMGNSLAYADMKIDEKLASITGRLNLFSMLNTKYLVSAYELPETGDLLLIKTASSTRFNIPIYLYENKKVMPRIYFANSIEFIIDTDEEKNFKTEIESNTDYSKKTFIECSDCQEYRNLPSNEDKIDIKEYKDGYLNLNTQTERGRWLIFSESNLPGWRITIDGQNTQSYMANYLFHGLYIPKGDHNVMFEYVGI